MQSVRTYISVVTGTHGYRTYGIARGENENAIARPVRARARVRLVAWLAVGMRTTRATSVITVEDLYDRLSRKRNGIALSEKGRSMLSEFAVSTLDLESSVIEL